MNEVGEVRSGKIFIDEDKVCNIDTSKFCEGTKLFLSDKAGELTATPTVGIKDKNGVELRLGDYVTFKATTVDGFFRVVFHRGAFRLIDPWGDYVSFDHYEFCSKNIEVIQ